QPDNVALQKSILIAAMERGYLRQCISAVSRYLMTDGYPNPDLTRQYRKDLRERWMRYEDPAKQHKKCRAFHGLLVELQFAEWLESQGWRISGLAALGHKSDIEASATNGRATAFEVKSIGIEDADFTQILASLNCQEA